MKIRDNVETVGIVVLFVGVILLAFTFISAYGFLSGKLQILATADLTELFGRAMAPLIEAIIHILYLGIMGWIGSILTIRGVQLLKREKEAPSAKQPQAAPASNPQVPAENKQTSKPAAPQPVPHPKAESKQEVEQPKPTKPEEPKTQEPSAEPVEQSIL